MLRTGIDLVEIHRIRAAIEAHGDRFLDRVFQPHEIVYCRTLRDPYPHYAARFAAKEAFYKAIPHDLLDALIWNEVAVRRAATGAPELELSGTTRSRLAGWTFALSLSHTRELAIAQVLAGSP